MTSESPAKQCFTKEDVWEAQRGGFIEKLSRDADGQTCMVCGKPLFDPNAHPPAPPADPVETDELRRPSGPTFEELAAAAGPYMNARRGNPFAQHTVPPFDFSGGFGATPMGLGGMGGMGGGLFGHDDETVQVEVVLPTEDGHGFTVSDMVPIATVDDLKQQIYTERKIPIDRQILEVDGAVLDGSATLRDAGALGRQLTLNFVDKVESVPASDVRSVFVKTLTGQTTTITDLEGNHTVAYLKQRFQDLQGVPPDQMRLIFAGQQLKAWQTLGECNLQFENTVHMVVRLRGS